VDIKTESIVSVKTHGEYQLLLAEEVMERSLYIP
jgi:hypothetical protein